MDTSQLPAAVVATRMERLHTPVAWNAPPRTPVPVGVVVDWCNRKVHWSGVDVNGQGPNAVVEPGAALTIKVGWRTVWQHNSTDYCPGCTPPLHHTIEGIYNHAMPCQPHFLCTTPLKGFTTMPCHATLKAFTTMPCHIFLLLGSFSSQVCSCTQTS